MGMAAAVVAIFKTMLDETANAASQDKQRTVSVMATDFSIPSVTYTSGTIIAYVKNTGTASFDPGDMDVYVDGLRIPRSNNNRTVNVTSDTDLSSIGTWDGGEELEFTIIKTYSIPASHTISVHAPNGVSAESVFSS